ncbi:MAG: hypothetical protein Q7J55_04225, partial [bacterium]|nr:hypothetical protein [bacterium]
HLSNELGILKESKIKGDMDKLLEFLDEKSRQILMFLWWNRHAEIGELAQLVSASTDMEVLSKLKEVINPTAEKILGRKIVEFAESRIDQVTGEKVLFSWWLVGEPAQIGTSDKPLMDVFDEKDGVTIIAQLPAPVLTDHPEIGYKNNILRIRFKKGGQV